MPLKVAVAYNEPELSRYGDMGEHKAILGVRDAVDAVYRALKELDCSTTKIPLKPPMKQVMEQMKNLDCDLVFNLFEGFEGSPETEAQFARILDEFQIAFTGCPASALLLALDKSKAKALFKLAGIDTPAHQVLNKDNLATFYLTFPCIVKPCCEDASHGLGQDSLVKDFSSLTNQVERVSKLFGGSALVEEFIDGLEFNATVMGNEELSLLPVSEIVYSLPADMPRILTYAAKWEPGTVYFKGTVAECPAKISEELKEQIAGTCKLAFRLLGCKGYARVDMRQDAGGKIQVLELNPNPDISPGTGAARQAKAAGWTYSRFIEKIIKLALEKNNSVQVACAGAGMQSTI